MKAQICPVCGGTGHVDKGFYTQTSGQWASVGGTETCRSCGGQGYVVISLKPINVENSLNFDLKNIRDEEILTGFEKLAKLNIKIER